MRTEGVIPWPTIPWPTFGMMMICVSILMTVMFCMQLAWTPLRDVDSYYYLSIMQGMESPVQLIEHLFSGITFTYWVIYVFIMAILICAMLITSDVRYGFISALFIIIDPFFMFNASPMLIDKNIIYMMIFAVMVNISINERSWTKEALNHAVFLVLMMIYWHGWYSIAMILGLYHSIRLMLRYKRIVIPMILSYILFFVWFYAYSGLNSITWDVAELRPAFFFLSPYYYIYIFGLLVFGLAIWRNPDMVKPYHILLGLTTISFGAIFRMHTFFLIVFYMIVMPVVLKNVWQYKVQYGVVILMLSFMSYPMYNPPTIERPWMRTASEAYLSSNHTCAYNDWGYGHILQYYSYPKHIRYKGHPNDIPIEKDCFDFNQYMLRI